MTPDPAGTPRDRRSEEPEARRVRMVPGGPMLVEGPVEVVLDDGTTVTCDRFQVALCACRRSHRYPFCDTSHRARRRAGARPRAGGGRGPRPRPDGPEAAAS
ncbi:CDGSH iron-sulfur domain-containing protein [Actinomadura sp. NTSP31]|uniref:CDGSH iron-sulfur domain-containing protein n=1 Tax=Actinomadura sp. NTSP31 TaxID=1735447 RepID=UPI0035C0DB61